MASAWVMTVGLENRTDLGVVLERSGRIWGAWVAQSVERPTSAEVRISQFVSSSPASGSVLTARILQPASDSGSPSLSLCPYPAHGLSLCLKNELMLKVKKKKSGRIGGCV